MTECDILTNVPEGSVELAYDLLDVIEIYNSFVTPNQRFPESLVQEVAEDPAYFVNEGGANGTFQHAMLDTFNQLQPQLGLFAESLLH